MYAPTWDRTLLVLFVLLIPLRLLSLLRRTPSGGRHSVLSSALLLVSASILLSVILAVSDPRTSNNALSQLEEMKIKVAHLESKLDETTQALSSQTLYLEDKRKLVEEMERKTEFLQNELFKTKAPPSSSTESKRLMDALVEQVGLLWEASRKNNFIIHILESKAHDIKDSLKAVTSEFEKFIQSIRQYYLPEFVEFSDSFFLGDVTPCSWIFRVFEQFKFYTSAVKESHHEVQRSVKLWMEMHDFTDLANKEDARLYRSSEQRSDFSSGDCYNWVPRDGYLDVVVVLWGFILVATCTIDCQ